MKTAQFGISLKIHLKGGTIKYFHSSILSCNRQKLASQRCGIGPDFARYAKNFFRIELGSDAIAEKIKDFNDCTQHQLQNTGPGSIPDICLYTNKFLDPKFYTQEHKKDTHKKTLNTHIKEKYAFLLAFNLNIFTPYRNITQTNIS